MEMLNVALDYLGRGFSVIPVERETKEPVVRWAAYQYRPPSARTVRAWWDANEDYNPGIVTAAGASEEVRRLVIFDFDNGDRYANERGRLPDKTWVASTGRSRGKHVYLIAPEPIRTYSLDGLDIKGLGSFCVAPPAVHSSGRSYEFEHYPDHIAEVSWEQLEHFGVEPIGHELERRRPAWIPREAWLILSGCCSEINADYATRSEYEHAAILALIGVGAKLETIHAVFQTHAHTGSKFQTIRRARGERQAARWIEVSYRAAVRHLDRQWASISETLGSMLERLPRLQKSGAGNPNLKAVYGGFVRQARHCCKTELNVSIRELAEHAGLSASTAAAQVRSLMSLGLVRRLRSSDKNLATRYVLPDYSRNFEAWSNPYIPGGERCVGCTDLTRFDARTFLDLQDHDVFSSAGLGKTALAVWSTIRDASGPGVTAADLMRLLFVSRSTVQRVTRKMRAAGLLKKAGTLWRANKRADLDQIAIDIGAAGHGVRRKLRHISERVGYEATLGVDRREEHRRKALLILGVDVCPDEPDTVTGYRGTQP